MVAFQFQDRVCQILSHVQQDFDVLSQRLDAYTDPASGELQQEILDIEKLMAEFSAGYTTAEEMRNQTGDKAESDEQFEDDNLVLF